MMVRSVNLECRIVPAAPANMPSQGEQRNRETEEERKGKREEGGGGTRRIWRAEGCTTRNVVSLGTSENMA